MAKLKRFVLGIIILSSLLLLNSYYFLGHEQHREYPSGEDIIDGFQGGVVVGGAVKNVDSDGFFIEVKHKSRRKSLKVFSDLEVDKGDRVEVLGLLSQDKITPWRIIVVKRWSYYFVFIRSALAIPLVVYMFFSCWSFDIDEIRFRRRESA